MLLDAPRYICSTFDVGLGYIHGVAYTAEYAGMPPRWIIEAGEDLYSFATKAPRDEKLLSQRFKDKRGKFYEYMNAHSSR